MFKKMLLIPMLVFVLPVYAEDVVIDVIPKELLLNYLAEGTEFTLIDARSREEYDMGHIYGAASIPPDTDLAAVSDLPGDLDATIVVYCKSGNRAYRLKQKLDALGYTKVRILAPTQMMWADNLPVFNCGIEQPKPFTLQVVEASNKQTGGDQ